jgi:hypothetical protein
MKIVATTVVIPILVSVVTSFYINTRLLKPRLKVQYAWGDVLVVPWKDHPNDYIAVLIDIWPGLQFELPSGQNPAALKERQHFGGVHVTSAKHLSFKSSADYVLDYNLTGSRVIKVMLSNEGYVTANHLKIGVRFPDHTVNWRMVPSPNVKLTQRTVPPSGENPPTLRLKLIA